MTKVFIYEQMLLLCHKNLYQKFPYQAQPLGSIKLIIYNYDLDFYVIKTVCITYKVISGKSRILE